MNYSFSDLKDKVCVITGGAGIIGTAIVEALAWAGIKTAVLDIREDIATELAQSVQKKYGTKTIGIQCNVLEKQSLINARERVEKELGHVDILINGAGGNSPDATTKAEQITDEDINHPENTFFGLKTEGFDKVFALNFTGTLLPSMVFGENMVKRGAGNILNISSMNSYKPLTKIPAYSAAKAAINNFTALLKQLNLKNLYLVNRIKRIKTPDGNIWRGFDVQIEFAHGLLSITNMVVQTDLDHKISGVWLGMKPVDYRLLTRSYTEESAQQKINLAVGKVERIYTAALLGEGSYIEEYPDCPQEGWHWGEIEEVNIDLHENAVIYNYKLTLSGAEHSWEFKMQSLEGE